MQRVVVYTKDVMVITGRSEKYSRTLLRRIKEKLSKEQHQLVSFSEFCQFTGIPTQDVERSLKS
jgi:hypothetical protein